MSLMTVRHHGVPRAAVVHERGVTLVGDLEADAPDDVVRIIAEDRYPALLRRAQQAPDDLVTARAEVEADAPYRRPRMIWGIGLNYREHAGDLTESVPTEPASFIKADHTVIGPGEPIPIPHQSERTTSEAELGLVIGSPCRNVDEAAALDHVFGVCTILDQTAEDILERNPRFLTRSKNFPGFFSFGPEIVPLDALSGFQDDLSDVEVTTARNGETVRTNRVANMTFSPAHLVAFHSRVMPLSPGDIISTGTPGAVHIRPGDVVTCTIPGVGELTNPVVAQT